MEPFANPYVAALTGTQQQFRVGGELACRFPADVIPFGGVAENTPAAWSALRELLAPGEVIYTAGEATQTVPGLVCEHEIPGWQMHLRHSDALPELPSIELLPVSSASEMVALTDVAFPGFFRPRSPELGPFFGIRAERQLVAMAGTRLAIGAFREISAVCTHPAFTGRGYAAALIGRLVRLHADEGLRSFLHVSAANRRAIALYERLGFLRERPIRFRRLQRV